MSRSTIPINGNYYLLLNIDFEEKNFDKIVMEKIIPLRFIEDNWSLGRIGKHSYDEKADSILNLFDFDKEKQQQLASPFFLDPSIGLPISDR
ncbi:MAG TPA: hypothetical protein VFP49_01050 [Nitrososphaeraceae archaeon]|nr:hypothetical protein [Nitrososphaeraceae archaeon]